MPPSYLTSRRSRTWHPRERLTFRYAFRVRKGFIVESTSALNSCNKVGDPHSHPMRLESCGTFEIIIPDTFRFGFMSTIAYKFSAPDRLIWTLLRRATVCRSLRVLQIKAAVQSMPSRCPCHLLVRHRLLCCCSRRHNRRVYQPNDQPNDIKTLHIS